MNLGYSASLPSVAAERTPDYAVLFQREFPKVVCTVYLVVRDHGRAEELAQEAFVQLLMHWKKVSGYDRPEAWVRRVAIRLAMRSSTRERLRSVLERRAVVEPPPGEGVDLSEALGQLSAPQRAAIVLHYYEDRPVDEVADILVCSVNTVKSHLHRGRNKLRVLLGECEGDLDES